MLFITILRNAATAWYRAHLHAGTSPDAYAYVGTNTTVSAPLGTYYSGRIFLPRLVLTLGMLLPGGVVRAAGYHSLSSYALASRCPVLTEAMLLPGA
eukprot:2963434-Rhodomonas_salina.1